MFLVEGRPRGRLEAAELDFLAAGIFSEECYMEMSRKRGLRCDG
jgi:hypothetical protein